MHARYRPVAAVAAALLTQTAASSPPGHSAVQPRIVMRPRLDFVAIRSQTPLAKLSGVIQKHLPETRAWLASHGLKPAGPPFIRYRVIDMPRELDVEVGWPVAKPVNQTGRIYGGSLTSGRYVSLLYTGPYDGLVKANADLQSWATNHRIALEGRPTPKGEAFAGRAEFYITDPKDEPDPHKWKTEIVYLTSQAAVRAKDKR